MDKKEFMNQKASDMSIEELKKALKYTVNANYGKGIENIDDGEKIEKELNDVTSKYKDIFDTINLLHDFINTNENINSCAECPAFDEDNEDCLLIKIEDNLLSLATK